MDARVIVRAGIIFGVALLQNTSLFVWGGIKLDLMLLVMFLYTFIAHTWAEYGVYVLVASIGLMTEPGWDPSVASFIAVALLAYAARGIFPLQSWLTYGVMLVAGTILLYSFIDWHFIVAAPLLLMQELVYTMIGGALFYMCTARFYAQRSGRPF